MSRTKREDSHPTVSEAVEKLSSIAEMDFDKEIALAAANEGEPIISPQGEETPSTTTIDWLYKQDPSETLNLIKQFFHVILEYLKGYYKKEYRFTGKQQATEGIKAIMVIVGEAAKKLDHHKQLFASNRIKSVTDLPEYKHLQDFYLSKIARKIDEGTLSKWILALSQRLMAQGKELEEEVPLISTKHAFVDLDAVKKDSEYELFFIRKEDGMRYFSPRLIRNIKLVCDFGVRLGEGRKDDPLSSINIWRNKHCQICSKQILNAVSDIIKNFYVELPQIKEEELASCLGKCLMALMLASNPHHMVEDQETKNCCSYFSDFQSFLRQAFQSSEYKKMLAYPSERKNRKAHCQLQLLYALCQAFFLNLHGYAQFLENIQEILLEARELSKEKMADSTFSSQLLRDYENLTKLMKHHPNGPLIKVLDILEEGGYYAFDPITQGNIPEQLYKIQRENRSMINVRLPCPTHQEFIHKVFVVEEFKGLLHSLGVGHTKHKLLIFNLQDRTSWKEHSRCMLLEDLQKHADFSSHLAVVTLPKDTDFYHQAGHYQKNNQATLFMEHLKEQIFDENCGFFFPQRVKEAFSQGFIDNLVHDIHKIFFGGRNVLVQERRQDFIEIFYLFLELKILEIIKPDVFSFMCKDGIDTGPAASALLYVFLKLVHQEQLSKEDIEQTILMLITPSLFIRERVMTPDRFYRFINALKEIESVHGELSSDLEAAHYIQTAVATA